MVGQGLLYSGVDEGVDDIVRHHVGDEELVHGLVRQEEATDQVLGSRLSQIIVDQSGLPEQIAEVSDILV
jgi:hypothetical protein